MIQSWYHLEGFLFPSLNSFFSMSEVQKMLFAMCAVGAFLFSAVHLQSVLLIFSCIHVIIKLTTVCSLFSQSDAEWCLLKASQECWALSALLTGWGLRLFGCTHFKSFFPHCFWLVHFFLWNFHPEFHISQIWYFLITAVLASISVSNVDPFILSSSHSLNSVLAHICLLFCLILPAWPQYRDLSCHSFCFPRSPGLSDSCSESVGVQLCLQWFESYWLWTFYVFSSVP